MDIEDTIRCPRCGGHDVRPSKERGIKDSFMVALGRHPFRCRACECRFHKSVSPKSGGPPAEDPAGRDNSKAV